MNDTDPRAPHHVDQHVGVLIRARRRALGVSQSELAEALGVSFQQVQKYERGANRVSASKLYEIAQKLDTPLTAFFEGLDASTAGGAPVQVQPSRADPRGAQALVAAFAELSPPLRDRLIALAKAMANGDR